MSELIGLDEAKLHCRIDNDDSYEDAMIQAYIEASLEVCQKHIGKRFGAGLEFTPAIKIGCLMYVSQLYEYRTMISDVEAKEIPLAISALWSVYRDVGGVLMPWQPMRRCTEPGCNKRVKSGKCYEHKREAWRAEDARRGHRRAVVTQHHGRSTALSI